MEEEGRTNYTDILVVFECGSKRDQLQAKYIDGFLQLAGIGVQLDQQEATIGGWGCSLVVVRLNGNICKPSQESMFG